MADQICKRWRAVRHDDHLVVAGVCDFPTGGYTVRVDIGNQGINPNPKVLHLNVEVDRPTSAPTVLSTEIAIGIFRNHEAGSVIVDDREVPVENDLTEDIGETSD